MSSGKRNKVREALWMIIMIFLTVFFLMMAVLGEVFEIICRAIARRRK